MIDSTATREGECMRCVRRRETVGHWGLGVVCKVLLQDKECTRGLCKDVVVLYGFERVHERVTSLYLQCATVEATYRNRRLGHLRTIKILTLVVAPAQCSRVTLARVKTSD